MDLEALEAALAASPDNVPLLLLLAQGQLDAFALEEAKAYFSRALELEPENAVARTGLATLLELEGKTSEAVLRIEQVCAQSPGHAPAWVLRARLALAEESAEEARAYYERAVAADPTAVDPELLKRIVSAGGGTGRSKAQGGDRGRAVPQWDGGWAGGALDPDEWDEEDETDDYGEGGGGAGRGANEMSLDDLGLEFVARTDVDFSRVGGMASVKDDIRMKILYPMQNKDLFAAYGKKAGGGVLLYGPPGCGKTLISRATAGEIKANFLSVGLHQILDMWIGNSEKQLHRIFEYARQHAPAVLFFDEVDALAADRKDLRASAGRTLINQFLAELDGHDDNNDGVLVLGATNAPWHLDSAFLRPGRFDRLLFVPPPDLEARAEIVGIVAEGKPVAGLDAKALAKRCKDFSGADISAVFEGATEEALAEAMRTGKMVPITGKALAKRAGMVKPSTRRWFESAKNYALYANQSGFYDDVLEFLGIQKP